MSGHHKKLVAATHASERAERSAPAAKQKIDVRLVDRCVSATFARAKQIVNLIR